MKSISCGLVLALAACGSATGPEPTLQLAENEILVRGKIESASRLISLPISLSIPTATDPIGEDRVVVAARSDDRGRYELRAQLTAGDCAGEFAILIYDALDRWVGKRIHGCGLHTENFNVGIGFPAE